MTPYISAPKKVPMLLKLGIKLTEKITKKTMLPARILAWYPKAAYGSAVLESLVIHKPTKKEPHLTERLIKLVRMQVSFQASCPFCIDMNGVAFRKANISAEEIMALQGVRSLQEVSTFSIHERLALEYTRGATATPISFTNTLIEHMTNTFSQRELVVLASTIAQVNYWTRLIQAFGISPAGFSDKQECAILHPENYKTLKNS